MLSVDVGVSEKARGGHHGDEVGGGESVVTVVVDGCVVYAYGGGEDGSETGPVFGIVAVGPFEGEFRAVTPFCVIVLERRGYTMSECLPSKFTGLGLGVARAIVATEVADFVSAVVISSS
jgi:hypothetical protein